MCNIYRGPFINASYQVSVHLAKRFQRRRFFQIDQSETKIACGGHHILSRSVNKHSRHRQFLFLIGWFLKNLILWNRLAKKIFSNRQIRNKNCLWWPCLLTDQDEMYNLYRGPSINASYQVSVHGHHRQFLFLICRFEKIFSSETAWPMNRNLVGSI
jgi:hypothetical protein